MNDLNTIDYYLISETLWFGNDLIPFHFFRDEAENCMRYINGTRLDDRIVRTDWDAGFVEGRQYGRGKSGGQV